MGTKLTKEPTHRLFDVDILPNSIITDAVVITDYTNELEISDYIMLYELLGVNVLFNKDIWSEAIDSKENFISVYITEHQITNYGSNGQQTYGEFTGIFYGTIDYNKSKNLIQNNNDEKIGVISNGSQPTFSSQNSSNAVPVNYSNLSNNRGCYSLFPRWGSLWGCLPRLFQLVMLLLLILFLLKKCNTCNKPSAVPEHVLDSLSIDNDSTYSINANTAVLIVNDWDRIDNDIITIRLNQKTLAQNIKIVRALQFINIDNLKKGNNELEIIPVSFGKGNVTAVVEITDMKNSYRFKCDIKRNEIVRKNLYVK